MRGCMMIVGLIRTVFVSDYRSTAQRRQIRKLGYEFLDEGITYIGGFVDEVF